MTRLGRTIAPRDGRRFDLEQAFRFLGVGAGDPELAMAADLLRSSGLRDLVYDDELVVIAERKGSSGIDALDLVVVFHHGIERLRVSSPRPKGGVLR